MYIETHTTLTNKNYFEKHATDAALCSDLTQDTLIKGVTAHNEDHCRRRHMQKWLVTVLTTVN